MTLASGQVFMQDATHEFTDIETGEQVTITYEERNGQNVILSIRTSPEHRTIP